VEERKCGWLQSTHFCDQNNCIFETPWAHTSCIAPELADIEDADTMKKLNRALILFFCTLVASSVAGKDLKAVSEQQIKRQIIEESIASYPGRCPCPYNTTRNGSSCGGRSAWSRKGGYAPICYEREVTKEMVSQRRQRDSQMAKQETVPER
jgi:hypothetical protein